MNNDFRQRVFLPIILPLGVIIGFFGFAFMLSRVLLAVDEMVSTTVALGLAAYILAIAAIVASKPKITSRALAVGVALGVVAIVVAGVLASVAGMRELHHGPEAAAAEGEGAEGGGSGEGGQGGEGGGEGGQATEGGSDAAGGDGPLEWVAVDIDFEAAPAQAPAGEQEITLVNDGNTLHNVTFPDISDSPVVEADGGDTAQGTVELEPGTYEYICSVPGHETLMKGELTVE